MSRLGSVPLYLAHLLLGFLRRMPAVVSARTMRWTPLLRSGLQAMGYSARGYQRTKISQGGAPRMCSSLSCIFLAAAKQRSTPGWFDFAIAEPFVYFVDNPIGGLGTFQLVANMVINSIGDMSNAPCSICWPRKL